MLWPIVAPLIQGLPVLFLTQMHVYHMVHKTLHITRDLGFGSLLYCLWLVHRPPDWFSNHRLLSVPWRSGQTLPG